MAHRIIFIRLAAAGLVVAGALSTSTARAQSSELPSVNVSGRWADTNVPVAGFGDIPLSRSPLQATTIGEAQMRDAGASSLAALTRFDSSIGDAYNAAGYWSSFTVRGFTLDNRYNFFRDGLPINAETSIGLANKARIDVLKGTSGIQAGTSAPGGIVYLIVKRPDVNLRSAVLQWIQPGTFAAAADLSQRFGPQQQWGLRINVDAARLDPTVHDLRGERRLVSIAADWKPNADTSLEAEVESSHQSQRSQPGFSLLGSKLPSAQSIDPRINLNDQPWSEPVVLDGNTGSLRWQQRLDDEWRFIAHLGIQRLHSDDRAAFPFGCSADKVFDRYCSDGSFDLYDYRSDAERRNTDALDVGLRGTAIGAGLQHQLAAGVLETRFRARFGGQAYNYAGVGTIDGRTVTPPSPDMGLPNTNRDERSTELYLRDAITINERFGAWLGLRHSRISRSSIGTDGSQPLAFSRSFTTPWAALTFTPEPGWLVYTSWGEGVEAQVVPNLPIYSNHSQPLPPLKSRQTEIGVKRSAETLEAALTAFDIRQPRAVDVGADCGGGDDASCTRVLRGNQQHRGVEASAAWKPRSDLTLQASATRLRARIDDADDSLQNGKRPTNVPQRSYRANASFGVGAVPGLDLHAGWIYEGERAALPDNSIDIPSWSHLDLSASYRRKTSSGAVTWLVGVDNVADHRAWRESPYQYDHVYLFPLAPRTWRVQLQVDL